MVNLTSFWDQIIQNTSPGKHLVIYITHNLQSTDTVQYFELPTLKFTILEKKTTTTLLCLWHVIMEICASGLFKNLCVCDFVTVHYLSVFEILSGDFD